MNNTDFYNSWRSAPENALKEIKAGNLKGKSDINPQWRIQVLTEKFGPVGFGWYTKITEHWTDVETIQGVIERVAWVRLELYVKHPETGEWSAAIEGIGGSKYAGMGRGKELNDEAFKMAETDAISVACKKLGIAADVYWDSASTKYTSVQPQTQQRPRYTPISLHPEHLDWRNWLIAQAANGCTLADCEKVANQNGMTIPREVWDKCQEAL